MMQGKGESRRVCGENFFGMNHIRIKRCPRMAGAMADPDIRIEQTASFDAFRKWSSIT